ncbi:MAG: endonuclease/exonuclease/phosphatase family metal-dependent hydrolase [Verrucomicrobiales bacterium]
MSVFRVSPLLAALFLSPAIFFGLHAQEPDPAAAEDSGDIRFVAWNLKNWLRQDRKSGGEWVRDVPKAEEEKTAVIGMLARLRPQILGVCEIGNMKDIADFRARLKNVGLEYPHLEWVESADPVRHLALLSQFPIESTNSVSDLTYMMESNPESGQGQMEVPVWRGILDATVQVNENYQLRLIGAHLKSKREVPEGDQALMRRNEAQLFRKHIDSIYEGDPDVNLMVYGDFNDTRNEPPIKAIQGKFGTDEYLRSLLLEDRNGYRWTHHWEFADIYSRIDFIFVSKGLTREVNRDRSFIYHRDDWDVASDHRMLVAAISPVDVEDD